MVLLSSTCLKNAVDNYTTQSQENFKGDSKKKSKCVACVVVAIIIFVIEVAVLYFALDIAINTTTSGAERFVHVVLAVLFTMPYLLFSLLLNEKARAVLVGSGSASLVGSSQKFRMRDAKQMFKMCGGGNPSARFACGMN